MKTCSVRTNVSENAFSIAASKVVVALSVTIFKARFDLAAKVVYPRRISDEPQRSSVRYVHARPRTKRKGTRRWLIETLAKVRADNVVDADRRQELGRVGEEREREEAKETRGWRMRLRR